MGCVIILTHAVPRILHPEPSNVSGMLLFAVAGVLVNGAAVLRLKEGVTMNERVVMWHLIEDVLGWLAVLVAGVVMLFKELPVIDPLLASVITLYVLWNALKNLRRTGVLFLQGVPESVNLPALEERIRQLEGIRGLHDLHVWSMDGSYHVVSLHVMTYAPLTAAEVAELKGRIRAITREVGIEHATIEVETTEDECCP
ncbi:MAG: cation transporter [Candidatus Nitrosotenuis sp.]|nr:MAG: cation transporter [Candidatus Nitrosotenuis sp.]